MANAKQEEMLEKKAKLRQGGGEKAIARQHSLGKYTARERLEKLFDENSFVETGVTYDTDHYTVVAAQRNL